MKPTIIPWLSSLNCVFKTLTFHDSEQRYKQDYFKFPWFCVSMKYWLQLSVAQLDNTVDSCRVDGEGGKKKPTEATSKTSFCSEKYILQTEGLWKQTLIVLYKCSSRHASTILFF